MATSTSSSAESQGPLSARGSPSLPCVQMAASAPRAGFLALVESWTCLEAEEFAALDPKGLPPLMGAVRRK